jgi:hypothetical protein
MLVKKSGFASNAKDVPINPGSTVARTKPWLSVCGVISLQPLWKMPSFPFKN